MAAHITFVISNSRLNRLGDSIRDGTLSPEDREVLAEMRLTWGRVRRHVLDLLEEYVGVSAVEITTRIKNIDTLRDKLHRLHGGLSGMRDIVGLRVVVPGPRANQMSITNAILALFPDSAPRVISRIDDPRAGYRAIHIEIRVDAVRVEIQVRTVEQHEWANAMERFADKSGRDARYEDEYNFTNLSDASRNLAIKAMRSMIAWSESLNDWEADGSPESGPIKSTFDDNRTTANSRLEAFDASL